MRTRTYRCKNFVKLIFAKTVIQKFKGYLYKKIEYKSKMAEKPAEKNPLEIQIPMVPTHRHRSIVSDHEQILDGIRFREKKEMVRFSSNNSVKLTPAEGAATEPFLDIAELVHTRYIGNEKYLQVTETWKNGEKVDEEINSNLENAEAIEGFKKQWVNWWYPALIHMANMNLQRDH